MVAPVLFLGPHSQAREILFQQSPSQQISYVEPSGAALVVRVSESHRGGTDPIIQSYFARGSQTIRRSLSRPNKGHGKSCRCCCQHICLSRF